MSRKKNDCHDCGAKEGELHQFGCDNETCPFCGKQLVGCNCCYIHLGYKYDGNKLYCGLPEKIYTDGLPNDEWLRWKQICDAKGRIPWVKVPLICALCGQLWPDFFFDDDWEKFVIPELQNQILCKTCFNRMKQLFPKGWKKINETRKSNDELSNR